MTNSFQPIDSQDQRPAQCSFSRPQDDTSHHTSSFLVFQSPPSRISTSVTSRMTQGIVNTARMKPAIQNYLEANDPIEAGERTVIIMTSKVAQKSYGTEKR